MVVEIHPLISGSYTQTTYQCWQGGSTIGSPVSPSLTNSKFNVMQTLLGYGSDFYGVVSDGTDTYTSNSVEVWYAITSDTNIQ